MSGAFSLKEHQRTFHSVIAASGQYRAPVDREHHGSSLGSFGVCTLDRHAWSNEI